MKLRVQIPIRCLFLLPGLFLSAGAFSQDAMFVDAVSIYIKGSKQGVIKGDVTAKGREGTIEVLGFSHEVVSPRDAASGQATGKRQHKPVLITKKLDKATPLLYAALTSNENLPEVVLSFYRPARKSTGEATVSQYFTIKLQNATITEIKTKTGEKGQPVEELSFTYQKIVWTYTDGGVTHEDTWISRN